jgi:cytochrome c oxidase subunit 3
VKLLFGSSFVGYGEDSPEAAPGAARVAAAPARVFFGFFLLVVTMLFFLLTIAYLSRAQFGDWQSLAATAEQPFARPWPLWFNTALLLLSSGALQWAASAVKRGDLQATRRGVATATFFALAFLAGQLWVWQMLTAQGYLVAANPANSFFYLITGLHGAHLSGGLIALAVPAVRLARGAPPARLRGALELCSVYWHFLFAVWLAMFALLASPQETLSALAAFCGIR